MHAKIALISGGLILAAACSSNWQSYGIDTACQEQLWFVDADADGWGSPDIEGVLACTGGDTDANPLVRNDRDCDDAEALVTGRSGSICPDQLVAGADPTEFTPSIIGNEFIAVHESTPVVWPGAGADSCGPLGWGGSLATFGTIGTLEGVLDSVPDVWAGWVGYSPTEAAWGHYDLDGTWVAATTQLNVDLCDDNADYSQLPYLALVTDGPGALDYCLGSPLDLEGTTTAAYEQLYAHFICERTAPNRDDYALAPITDGAADTD